MPKKRRLEEEAKREEILKRQRNERGGAGRRAGNPVVKLNNLLKTVTEALRAVPEHEPFVHPVAKVLPSYIRYITHPMDLHTMTIACERGGYKTAAAFISDLELIASNCHEFNTKYSRDMHLEPIARRMVQQGRETMAEQAEVVAGLEAEIVEAEQAPKLQRKPSTRHRPSRRKAGGAASEAPVDLFSGCGGSSLAPSSLASSSLASSSTAASSDAGSSYAESSYAESSYAAESSYQADEDAASSYAPSGYPAAPWDDAGSEAGSSLFDRSGDDETDGASDAGASEIGSEMDSKLGMDSELGGISAAPSLLGSPAAPSRSDRAFSFASSAQGGSGRLSSLGEASEAEMGDEDEEDPFADG